MGSQVSVLWLIKGLGPGGAEQLLASIAGVRDRERLRYSAAYLLPWKSHLVPKLEAHGVPVQCLDARHLLQVGWIRRLRRLVLDERIDIVHMHSPSVAALARPALRALPAARRPRLYSTEHNVWWSYATPTRWLNAATLPLEDGQFAVSEEVLASVHPRLRRRMQVVVHGVDQGDIAAARADRAAVRRELGVPDDHVVICTVANFRAQKNYPFLLRAAQRTLARHEGVSFWAVGQGPLEPEIRQLHGELGLGDRFRLLGYRQDAMSILAASDVFVLASSHEGFPVALMEALAVGVPVVATHVGGIPQAVRQGVEGYTVPVDDLDALAGRLSELIEDPERRGAMAQAARRRGEMFDIVQATRALEHVYLSGLTPGSAMG